MQRKRGKKLESINFPFPSGAHFTPALFARFLIMFSGFENFEDPFPLNLFLKALEGLIERFVLANLNFRHKSPFLLQKTSLEVGLLYCLPMACQGNELCNLLSCNKIEKNISHLDCIDRGFPIAL